MNNRAPLCLAVMAMLAACSSIPLPPDRMERFETEMRGAEASGARRVCEANMHLEMARDQADAAKTMAAGGEVRAVLVIERAESDAELALAFSREAAMRSRMEWAKRQPVSER
jgi:hypothetical protein